MTTEQSNTTVESEKGTVDPTEPSFAETALKLGGKSDDEARRTGAVDAADDQVEAMFSPQYQTQNSPAHRAVWDRVLPVELFDFQSGPTDPDTQAVMDKSIDVVVKHRDGGTLLGENHKITEEVFEELGSAGYWGLLVDKQYGGSGSRFVNFARFLTRMATCDPTVAGLASVHGCIGAVDPVRTFGSPEQKQKYLPKLATGECLSAFALTEPCAGSDLTALRTRAHLDGDEYVVNGEKLFITNATTNRTVGLVCLIEDKPAVLIADLPKEENEHFQIVPYGLYALKHAYNQGLIFKNFRVPAENLLTPVKGDGLTIAYHGLNLGRVALCANAAGTMRVMLQSILPWANYRKTYGDLIARRELVQRRIGHMAGLIVACDALVEWCGSLIDNGYRGEMECIIAKIFGSEAQKEASIELTMKTHGGRSFLHGHLIGDNVHEFLAPCIYEGEGEMLGMAFFKSLVKHHGKTFFEPIGKALYNAGIKNPNPMNPAHAWVLKGPLWTYSKWFMSEKASLGGAPKWPSMPKNLKAHADFAADFLQKSRFEVTGTMRKFQLALADRQLRMAELSHRIQTATVILCTSLYAARNGDELVQQAADCLCLKLTEDLKGGRPSDRYFKKVSKLGEAIANGKFQPLEDVATLDILMPYEQAG